MSTQSAYIRNPEDIRVLIGCECSGAVRKEFEKLGFDAYSCDLQPDIERSNRHMQCDIREVMNEDWDFLAVMHPPCTALTNTSVRWLKVPPGKLTPENYLAEHVEAFKTMSIFQRHAFMWESLDRGAQLFADCLQADVPCKALENPIMHCYAREAIQKHVPSFDRATQTVQPWWFGDPFFKATGLHLENVPKLVATDKLTPPAKDTDEHKAWSYIHRMPPGPDRAKKRSITFPGVAREMAAQWGAYLLTQEHQAA